MDALKEIIDTLDEHSVNEFRNFIHRQRKRQDRVDWEIFLFLRENSPLPPAEMAKKFCNSTENDKEAYYAVRKRLLHSLGDFLMLKAKTADTTAGSAIMGLISLSRYLFNQNLPTLAWEQLRKAETMSNSHEQYKMLSGVHILMIEFAHHQQRETLDTILARYQTNLVLIDEEDRAVIAHSVIRQRLAAKQKVGQYLDFDNVVQETLQAYNLAEVVLRRPKMLFNVISIVRSAYIANKDYVSFEPYMMAQYHAVKARGGFDRHHHYYRVHLLYLIAHILYRNRKFEDTLTYLDEMHESLLEYGKSHYALFYPKYVLLRAAVLAFTGNNEGAITLYKEVIDLPQGRADAVARLTAHMNLCVCNFWMGDFAAAEAAMQGIGRSDAWCERKMGKEWLLRKKLIEVLTQFELGNSDEVIMRIRRIERHFKEFFRPNRPVYNKIKLFLTFVQRFVDDPDWVSGPAYKDILASFPIRPDKREDTQALLFYSWMKAKANKQPFYAVATEMMRQ